jgi:hypothetical protein
MATFYETVLPTARAIRYKGLDVEEKLALDKSLGREATTEDVMKATVIRCVVAYTKPLVLLYKEEKGPKGEVVRFVDVDAMLEDATAKKLWVDSNPLTFATAGDTNFYAVFRNPLDFERAVAAINTIAVSEVKDVGLLAGKARVVSGAP